VDIGIRLCVLTCLLGLPCVPACSTPEARELAPHTATQSGKPASTTAPAERKKSAQGPIAPPRRNLPGQRADLSLGKIYVPDYFSVESAASTDVVFWFLGASWCTEQTFYDARKNGVLITVTVKQLWETFRHPDALARLLDEATAWLRQQSISDKPIGRICLTSFSGGYVAVREILKQSQFRNRITDVVLADSLYAPRVPEKKNELDPDAMAPFLDYARRASAGECVFLFSHLYPPEEQYRGNTTTLAASYLIDRLHVPRRPASSRNSRGAQLLYRADRGGFHVFGYAGMTTQDHFDHFYAASDLLRQTSLAFAD